MKTPIVMWPENTFEHRPWTRWWWLGSAVDKPTISRLLKQYHDAGLGGVEITCIYGVQGQQSNNVNYLSDAWVELIQHTLQEAKQLGMGVDLPLGSGSRIGGDFISDDVSAAELKIEMDEEKNESRAICVPSNEQVKRPGPAGGGRCFNPFSLKSLQTVENAFSPVFKTLDIRSQFHDSWEYDSNACPEIFDRFIQKRGYDVRDHLPALSGHSDPDTHARVKYDYQLTLAELALEEFIAPWHTWCHSLGQQSRNQAHGSPGNLLDLYAAVDIPETESFRKIDSDLILIAKFASSAAHLKGRPITSSETGTWAQEHFQVTLAEMKRICDTLFLAGINHHIYHGTAYSPANMGWPGWLFYASAQLNPQNSIWRDFPKLNEYVTRCQSLLQHGTPANDLLVYFPFHDVLQDPTREFAAKLTIDGEWLTESAAIATLRQLWKRGYSFDYISDRQLTQTQVQNGTLRTGGGTYRAVVIPACQFMPLETLEKLQDLSAQGIPVLFDAPSPSAIPGMDGKEFTREIVEEMVRKINKPGDLESQLSRAGIPREPLKDIEGLNFIRRNHAQGSDYFLVNEGPLPVDDFLPFAMDFTTAVLMDPMSGQQGIAQSLGDSPAKIRIQLDPGSSLILRGDSEAISNLPAWPYREVAGDPVEIPGPWKVEFIAGGPELPKPYVTDTLTSWTDTGKEAERFAGAAVYRCEFDLPTQETTWQLNLGQVESSVRVRLNGKAVDPLIGPEYKTILRNLMPSGNLLEVEVTSLSANRIRHLDQQGTKWRIFEDINFVNKDYQKFDARNWPIFPAVLIGPVQLTPISAPRRNSGL
ncbi:glycosyl hydrolase [Kiritimatiellaeota bacterium B1221]|nr:glycosyl hydrolase [Kiritimatiellaeota bacterium B1221]